MNGTNDRKSPQDEASEGGEKETDAMEKAQEDAAEERANERGYQ